VPEPHGFTVRSNIVRLRAVDRSRVWLNPKPALPSRFTPNAAASTASRPASLTIRIRPSVGRGGKGYIPESGRRQGKISENRKFYDLIEIRDAEADELADAVMFLASSESTCLTGSEIVVDGGLTGSPGAP
jgi:NAD(P)-dependent dehydrogenase (short-subunit alcohol dehydrogenase family)